VPGPLGIANCVMWLDASKDVYSFSSLANPGDLVYRWLDQSGYGTPGNPGLAYNTAITSPVSYQPEYDSQTYNGLPTIRFFTPLPGAEVNSNCFLGIEFAPGTIPFNTVSATPITIFVVWGSPSIASQQTLSNGANWYIGAYGAMLFCGLDGTLNPVSQQSAPFNINTPYGCMFVSNGTTAGFYSNGINYTTNPAAAQLGISGAFFLGAMAPQNTFADIGEVIIYNRALLTTEIANVIGYLTLKWDLGIRNAAPPPPPPPVEQTVTTLIAVPNTAYPGQPVELSANVTTAVGGAEVPYGTVDFILEGETNTNLGTAPVRSGSAAISVSSLPLGNDMVVASFGGSLFENVIYNYSSSSLVAVTINPAGSGQPLPPPGVPPITTPLAIANCVLWLDANQGVYSASAPSASGSITQYPAVPGDQIWSWQDQSSYQALVINNQPGGYPGPDAGIPVGQPYAFYAIQLYGPSNLPSLRFYPTNAVQADQYAAWLDVIYDGPLFISAKIPPGNATTYNGPRGNPFSASGNTPISIFAVWSMVEANVGGPIVQFTDHSYGGWNGAVKVVSGEITNLEQGTVWYINADGLNGDIYSGNNPSPANPGGFEDPLSLASPIVPGELYVTCAVSNGSSAAVYINGANLTSNSGDALVLGSNLCIGGGPFSICTNDIMEVVIYNRVLTPTEITQVSNYLLVKWTGSRPPESWMASGSASLILRASSTAAIGLKGMATATLVLHAAATHKTGWAVAATATIILSAAAKGPTAYPRSVGSTIILAAAARANREYPVAGAAEIILRATAKGPTPYFLSAEATIILAASAVTNDRSVQFATATIVLAAACVPARPAPAGASFRTPVEVIRPVRRRQPWVHGPLPYVVEIMAQAGATLILSASASQTTMHNLPTDAEAVLILSAVCSVHGDATTSATATIILRARARSVFPEVDFASDYLGRFQQGQEVPLWTIVRDQDGQPTEPTTRTPWVRVYDLDTHALVEVANMVHLRYSRVDEVYSLALWIGEGYPVGRYGVLYEAPTGGFTGIALGIFEVLPGGDPAGPVVAAATIARSTGDLVLGNLATGSLVVGQKPSVS
jgi:hypothetical protein